MRARAKKPEVAALQRADAKPEVTVAKDETGKKTYTVHGDLVLDKNTEYDGNLVVEGEIKGRKHEDEHYEYTGFELFVKGDLSAEQIVGINGFLVAGNVRVREDISVEEGFQVVGNVEAGNIMADENPYCDSGVTVDGNVVAHGWIRARGIEAGGSVIAEKEIVLTSFRAESNHGIEAGGDIIVGGELEVREDIRAGGKIMVGKGIVTFKKGLKAKSVECLRLCVGLYSKEEQSIDADVIEGTQVVLGRIVEQKD